LEEQPHAKEIDDAPKPAVWSADEGRELVPVARNEERPLPDALRKIAGRAPMGNRNAYKHGRYTTEAIKRRKQTAELIRMALLLAEEA